jgi:hypothetical protein
MERSAMGLLVLIGMTVGGFVPEAWGAGAFSVSSLLFGALGGVASVWLGARFASL